MTITRRNDSFTYRNTVGNEQDAAAVMATLPAGLLTLGDAPNSRIRVDVAQTGFFDGREMRTFKRISLAAGATLVVRAVVPINVILFRLAIEMVDGWADIETRSGGTAGGTFAETLPIFKRNNMSTAPVYTPQVVLTAGGTHTGGTVLDVIAARSSGATAQAASVGNATPDERGIGAGTYYFVVTNPGSSTATGVWRAWWEERP